MPMEFWNVPPGLEDLWNGSNAHGILEWLPMTEGSLECPPTPLGSLEWLQHAGAVSLWPRLQQDQVFPVGCLRMGIPSRVHPKSSSQSTKHGLGRLGHSRPRDQRLGLLFLLQDSGNVSKDLTLLLWNYNPGPPEGNLLLQTGSKLDVGAPGHPQSAGNPAGLVWGQRLNAGSQI